jgi:hypothetical protein
VTTTPRAGRASTRRWILIIGGYLAVSLLLTHDVLIDGVRHATVWPEGDASLPIWANGWALYAVSHLHNPLFSSAVWAPRGMNLLANTTQIGLAIVFIPVTWVLGPIGAYNAQLIVLPVVSGVAMVIALRPWVRSPWAAWWGGLVWAFSPVVLASDVLGYSQYIYLATPPLLFWLAADLVRFHKMSPRTVGLLAGCTLTFQLLVGTELLLITLTTFGLVAVVAGATWLVRRRPAVCSTLRRAGRAVPWFLVVVIPLAVPLVVFASFGPEHVLAWVHGRYLLTANQHSYGAFVTHPVDTSQLDPWPAVSPAMVYAGPTLLLVVAAITLWRARERIVRVLAAVAIVGAWLSQGRAAVLHPWLLLWNLPVIHNVIASRFIVMMWFGVAALVGLGLDRAMHARVVVRPVVRLAVAALFPVLALTQLADAAIPATHLVIQSPQRDVALTMIATPGSTPTVLTFPYPHDGRNLLQQAGSSFPYRLIGGWGRSRVPVDTREAAGANVLEELAEGLSTQPTPAQLEMMRAVITQWGVSDIIVPTSLAYPPIRGYREPFATVTALTQIYGLPTRVGDDWVWHPSSVVTPIRELTSLQWLSCAGVVPAHHPLAVPTCVTGAPRAPSGVSRPSPPSAAR